MSDYSRTAPFGRLEPYAMAIETAGIAAMLPLTTLRSTHGWREDRFPRQHQSAE